jgi:hypothetical protein
MNGRLLFHLSTDPMEIGKIILNHDVPLGTTVYHFIILPLTVDYYNNNTKVAPAICKKYKSNGPIQEQSQNSVRTCHLQQVQMD